MVYKVTRGDEECVLKVGLTEESVAEIQKNIRGYELLRNQGLNFFIPKVYASGIENDSIFILMEYCGDCFSGKIQQENSPEKLYEKLINDLLFVYSSTKTAVHKQSISLEQVQKVIVDQYKRYLSSPFDPGEVILPQLASVLDMIKLGNCFDCFASWDFTPQNVFIPNGQVKYVDPNDQVVGIPIIDLACFAGVIHDVELLPAKEIGYELLQNSVLSVATILEIPENKAMQIFYLGRVLQSFLSSRFRIVSNPTKALWFFNQGVKYLEKITK
jgi:hypothetical protein